jgi:hypothetical protein
MLAVVDQEQHPPSAECPRYGLPQLGPGIRRQAEDAGQLVEHGVGLGHGGEVDPPSAAREPRPLLPCHLDRQARRADPTRASEGDQAALLEEHGDVA